MAKNKIAECDKKLKEYKETLNDTQLKQVAKIEDIYKSDNAKKKKSTAKSKNKKQSKIAAYDDDSIEVITDDIDRLRQTFGMYIGYTGTLAFLHLIKEVLQNSIDEAVADISPCDEIFIYYNVKKKEIRIVDNGRGIPLTKIEAVCSYIQSSGKFSKGDDNAYKFAAGLNGEIYAVLKTF